MTLPVGMSIGADCLDTAQGQSKAETDAKTQAEELRKKKKDEDKAKEWRDQPVPKKKD